MCAAPRPTSLALRATLRRVRDRIDRDYAQPLDVATLARDAHMSAGYLSRQFRQVYGRSPYSYLAARRIERAMTLLSVGELSVTDACFAVGYESLGSFSSRFRRTVGVAPSAYRRHAPEGVGQLPPCVGRQVTAVVRIGEAPSLAPPLP